MRDKILLELIIPSMEKRLEIRVPKQMKVAQLTNLLIEFFQKENGEYIPTRESTLCEMKRGNILDPNAFIDKLDLQNGSQIMLI